MAGEKRPSRAIDPEVAARARELRADGLSFRQIERRLRAEEMPASLSTIHAACAGPKDEVGPEEAPAEVLAPAIVEAPAPEVLLEDELEAAAEAETLRSDALAAALAAAARGEGRDADTWTKVAERAMKIGHALRRRPAARPPASGPSANLQVNILTPEQAAMVAAAEKVKGGGS